MKLEIEQALSTWHTRIDVLCVVEDGWRVSCAGVASAESMQVLGEYKSPSHQREGAQALGYRPATQRCGEMRDVVRGSRTEVYDRRRCA
jgi:exosome complex RNA-binding protein Rrp42 (RNase PH superfamily)